MHLKTTFLELLYLSSLTEQHALLLPSIVSGCVHEVTCTAELYVRST